MTRTSGRRREIRLPTALAHQVPILRSSARFKLAICGRRFGKSAVGLLAAVRGHGPHRGARRGAIDGAQIWWVAQTFKIAAEIWRDLKRATHSAWVEKNEAERRIELPGGGSVGVRSADNPDSLRAVGLDGVVVDEIGFVSEAAWKQSLRPALTDKRGWALQIGTPNGCNWVCDLFESAPTRKDWARWQLPTSCNPLVDQHELDEALLDVGPRAFSQEYGAQFTDVEGAEFSGAYFGEKIWFDEWPSSDQVRFRCIALDPSLGETDQGDYSAFVLMALDWSGTMWVDADLGRRDAAQMVADGLRLCRSFDVHAFGVEINQFQKLLAGMFVERSKAAGFMVPAHGIHNTENKRTRIRQTLTPYLSREAFRFKRGSQGAKLLVAQLRSFPTDRHDDGPDALEMAVRLMQHLYCEQLPAAGPSQRGPLRVVT
ncbi:MAG TPA: phage terminase large subunit [Pirellulales bacterium]|nr:phage terminase large subunit [Pirellulales bacterium]